MQYRERTLAPYLLPHGLPLTAIAYLFPLTPFATIYVVWEMG